MTSFNARKDVKDIIEYFRDRVLKVGETTAERTSERVWFNELASDHGAIQISDLRYS